MNNVRLLAYFKNSQNVHTVKDIGKTFGVSYPKAYGHMRYLVDTSSLVRVYANGKYYYRYLKSTLVNWVNFYSMAFKGIILEPKRRPRPLTMQEFELLIPQTFIQRLGLKLRRLRIRLARWIYPY